MTKIKIEGTKTGYTNGIYIAKLHTHNMLAKLQNDAFISGCATMH